MEKELEFKEIINIIQNHRQNAYRKINEELVMMYYEIGQYLSKKLMLVNMEKVQFQKLQTKSKNNIQL